MAPLPLTDDDDETSAISSSSSSGTLSDRQEKLIALLPIIPTILSLIGSSTIIYMVIFVSKKTGKLTPYKRLLFGMSIFDILCSWIVPFSFFLLPKETSQRVWAFGNDVTCTVLGFFSQVAFCTILYNGMISFYFLLTVRFGYKEETITTYIEPIMHFLSIVYPLGCAILGAVWGVYHEAELVPGCWVNDYPDNCGDGPGQSGEKCLGSTIAWIFGGMIIFIIIISLFVNNILIYSFVRKTIRQSNSRLQRTTFLSRTMLANNNSTNNDITTADGTTTTNTTKKLKKKNKKLNKKFVKNENQERRIRLVATQAFLYVGGFLLSYIWTIILRILASMGFNSNDEQLLFPLIILQGIFLPLQGFINLFVYIRPNYLRLLTKYPNESKISILYRSIFGDDTIRPSTTNNRGVANSTTTRFTNFTTRLRNGVTRIRERIGTNDFSMDTSQFTLGTNDLDSLKFTTNSGLREGTQPFESSMTLDHCPTDVEKTNLNQEQHQHQHQQQQDDNNHFQNSNNSNNTKTSSSSSSSSLERNSFSDDTNNLTPPDSDFDDEANLI